MSMRKTVATNGDARPFTINDLRSFFDPTSAWEHQMRGFDTVGESADRGVRPAADSPAPGAVRPGASWRT